MTLFAIGFVLAAIWIFRPTGWFSWRGLRSALGVVAIALFALPIGWSVETEEAAGLTSKKWASFPSRELSPPGQLGEVRRIGALRSGDAFVLSESGLNVLDGVKWERVRGVDRPFDIAFLGQTLFVSTEERVVSLELDASLQYRVLEVVGPDALDSRSREVFSLARLGDRVFGTSGHVLFEMNAAGEFLKHELGDWCSGVFAVDDILYLMGGGGGILNSFDVDEGRVKPCDWVEGLGAAPWFTKVRPGSDGRVWLFGQDNSLWTFDGNRIERWKEQAGLFEGKVPVSDVVELDGLVAVGTRTKGVCLFDREGGLEHWIGTGDGISRNGIEAVGADTQGGLWVATNRGISRLDVDSRIRVLDERHGLRVTVAAVAECGNWLYVGGEEGLFRLDSRARTGDGVAFESVDGFFEVRNLEVSEGNLWVSGSELSFIDASDVVKSFPEIEFPNAVVVLEEGLVACGNTDGVWLLVRKEGVWQSSGLLPGCEREAYSLAVDSTGGLHASIGFGGVVSWVGGDWKAPGILKDMSNGSGAYWHAILEYESEVVLEANGGFRWSPDSAAWESIPNGEATFGESLLFAVSVLDKKGQLWAAGAPRLTKGHVVPEPVISYLSALSSESIGPVATCLFVADDGVAWVGGRFGLLIYNADFSKQESFLVKPHLSRIVDSKTGAALELSGDSEGKHSVNLNPGQDTITVHLGYRDFDHSEHSSYSIYLDGHDSGDELWMQDGQRTIAGIAPGDYRLDLRARLGGAVRRGGSSIPLHMDKPYFSGVFAFIVYGMVGVVLATVFFFLKGLGLRRRNRKLEGLVSARTIELERSNQKLGTAMDELKLAQSDLASASRMAGKGEVAAEMLHGIGNTLNSVCVGAQSIQIMLPEIPVGRLRKLAEMLTRRDDLEAYLQDAQNRESLLKYLAAIANASLSKIEEISTELHELNEHLDALKMTVATQEKHISRVVTLEPLSVCELAKDALSSCENAGSVRVEISPEIFFETDYQLLKRIVVDTLAVLSVSGVEGTIRVETAGDSNVLVVERAVNADTSDFGQEVFEAEYHVLSGQPSLHEASNLSTLIGARMSLDHSEERNGVRISIDKK